MTLLSAIGEPEPERPAEVKPPQMDLMGWLDCLWTKRKPEGSPPTFMMHRFLASDRDMASAARELQLLHESKLIFACWQTLLPSGRNAPRLAYVVPKVPPKAEALISKMMEALGLPRAEVERLTRIVELEGKKSALYAEFGIDE